MAHAPRHGPRSAVAIRPPWPGASRRAGTPRWLCSPLCSQPFAPPWFCPSPGRSHHPEPAEPWPAAWLPGALCPGAASACCQHRAAQLPCHTSRGARPGGDTGPGPVTYHRAVCLPRCGRACWSRSAFAPRHVASVWGGGAGGGRGLSVPWGLSYVGVSTHRRQCWEGACVLGCSHVRRWVLSGVRLGGGVLPAPPPPRRAFLEAVRSGKLPVNTWLCRAVRLDPISLIYIFHNSVGSGFSNLLHSAHCVLL